MASTGHESTIRAWLAANASSREGFSLSSVIELALLIPPEQQTKSDHWLAGRSLRAAGWKRGKQMRVAGSVIRMWTPPSAEAVQSTVDSVASKAQIESWKISEIRRRLTVLEEETKILRAALEEIGGWRDAEDAWNEDAYLARTEGRDAAE